MAAQLRLLLADDDFDDCIFFKEALDELPVRVILDTVNDGVELMMHLDKAEPVPDILFLDLNMPRKNGFDCLLEIKSNQKLKNFPVIIYSTSLNHTVADMLYENGAHHYIQKPGDFGKLKIVILKAIQSVIKEDKIKPGREQFLIESNN
jgi:DNA-binding NtrC family response regulator